MVLEPLKLIWAQSGKLPGVASFQPPLLPQLMPARSLSLRPAGPKDVLKKEETLATPPLLASATLIWLDVLTTCDNVALVEPLFATSPAYGATMLCAPS